MIFNPKANRKQNRGIEKMVQGELLQGVAKAARCFQLDQPFDESLSNLHPT